MSDSKALYFAGSVYLFGVSIKELNTLFNSNINTKQYLVNMFILGFSGGLLINSINQLFADK